MLKLDAPPLAGRESAELERRVADPAAYYVEPADAAADGALSRDQKLRLLTQWAQDLVDRQVADNDDPEPENVGDPEDTMLLRQLNAAIECVEAVPQPPGVFARIWRGIAG